MKKKKLLLGLVFIVICLTVCLSSGAKQPATFRPPAVPLVTVDPYMSVWSFSDHLYDSWPVHWTGQVHAMAGIIRVDGKSYRFMGPEAICPTAAKQTFIRVKPTRTIYTFEAGGVELSVIFMTPMLPSDLSLLTSPVTFITFQTRALDNKLHAVTVYFDVSGEWVVNKPEQKIIWRRIPNGIAGKKFISIGSAKQPILEKAGDNVRIDWGYLYVGAPAEDHSRIVATSHEARQEFIQTGSIPKEDDTRMPRAANDDWPVIACRMNLDTKSSKPVRQTIVLAYDDIFSIEYMGRKLKPWYYRAHGDFKSMLKVCIEQYQAIWRQCCTFDYALLQDARRIGGDTYKHLVSISYRHTWASGKVVISPDGSEPWFFHKECFSNGCMATVDVSYPTSPFFALFSPMLLNGMIAPVFEYAASEDWPYEFAPHDVGRYPKGNGQVYSRDRKTGKLKAERQMPVEECGNMILMTAAGAKSSGSAAFAKRYWSLLSQWANYLKDKGLDPEHQLCTDDFTGHLAHNVNLSLKAINALGGYAMLCDMLGKKDKARQFRTAAKRMAGKWQKMADDGDHYRLAFDKPGTWSMKYNLVWDEILGLGLFDPEIARKEVAYYLKIQNTYGLPLDNRADFTKSDWLVWCATLAEKKGDFEKLVYPLYRFTHESPDRVPFSDWYFTSTAKVRGFRARPVIGGVLIPFLKDQDRWQKWAGERAALKSRLIILADMGNEPDEEQQMVHMMMCSNEFDLEGLIAVTGKYLRPESRNPYKQVTHPELFINIINAYAKVLDNLKKHASGWHDPDYLKSIVTTGQKGYGIADVGDGKTSPGSELIIKAVTKDDPRPIWMVVNAGSNTLAQALWDYRKKHSQAEVKQFVSKLRVFENGAQDNAGAWICANFPKIHWIRSNYQTYCYGGPSGDGGADNRGKHNNLGPYTWGPYAYSGLGQHQWALEHIKGDHGPLGKLWPIRQFGNGRVSFLEGGGTIPWLGLVNKGLFDIERPHWGGWSGRFSRKKVENYWSKHSDIKVDEKKVAPFAVYKEAADEWIDPETGDTYNDIFTPVWRWRRAFYNDFVCRMDWCRKSYREANHHPVAAFAGDKSDAIIYLRAKPGRIVMLDASASTDPDGDKLEILWWIYKEAGTYTNTIEIHNPRKAKASITIPVDAAGKEFHVILEVKDKNKIASLYDYRRIVITITE